MEITSIVLARAIFIFELSSLNPVGRKTPSESTQQLQQRYGFAGFPRNFPEISADKGAEFASGRMGDIAIEKVTMYPNGIIIDTRSSTEDSETVGLDILQEAQKHLDSKVVITRRHFASQFVFRSDLRLENLNPVLRKISAVIARELAQDLRQPFIVEPSVVRITPDQTQVHITPANFCVERREDIPFAENTYFTSAPLRTGLHIELTTEFEKSLL